MAEADGEVEHSPAQETDRASGEGIADDNAVMLLSEVPEGLAEWVPLLTQAQLRVESPPKPAGSALGAGLAGAVAQHPWVVRVASAASAPAAKRVTVLLASVRPQVGLKDLPLVGSRVPAGMGELTGLGFAARSKAEPGEVTADWADLVRLLSPGTPEEAGLQLEEKDLQNAAAAVGVEVSLGAGVSAVRVWVPLGGGVKKKTRGTGHQGREVFYDGAAASAALWVAVNKTLGPLQVHRVGAVLAGGAQTSVGVLVDASFGAGPVVFATTGLGLELSRSKTGDFEVAGRLDGLGLSYRAGGVEVSGALARDPQYKPPELLVAGAVKVTTPSVGLTASGMYAHLKGGLTSAFVIGKLTGLEVPLGPVVLTGLTAGFGYNSTLVLPASAREVASHPLMAAELPVDQGALQTLEYLKAHVHPAPGSVWAAAGATFQVFKLVDVTAVVALQVAPGDVIVQLLAEASVRFPQTGTAYAQLALDMDASYRSSTGAIAVLGELDPARCYLLHPDVHLTGGFAFCTWISPSAHCGDFVVTLGGYHPDYQRPAHYPAVERLGLNWAAGGLKISGECYAAVTPSMVTLGGRLEASCSSSWASASLEAHLHVAVHWEPFSYLVDLGITARVTVPSLGLNLHPGLTLTVWGPPTGGTATISLPVVPDLTVKFGADRPAAEQQLSWAEFHERILHGRQPDVQVTAGLLPDPADKTEQQKKKDKDKGKKVLGVSAHDFTLVLSTPLPCSQLEVTGKDGKATSVLDESTHPHPQVNIRPMGSKGAKVTTTCTVTVAQGGKPVQPAGWQTNVLTSKVPASAFGEPLKAGKAPAARGAEELVDEAVTGLEMVFGPRASHPLDPIKEDDLDNDYAKDGVVPACATADATPTAGSRDRAHQALGKSEKATRQTLMREWGRYGLQVGAVEEPTGFCERLWSMTGAEPLAMTS
ncbi:MULTISPECIES: DUF6603 domain-containing protein [unclassified Streptomyces]|uniref:DUF6603 domain-containing protein n=1 Tax=unclassified Streptomyces TaxID=2593676 RepID=UPI0038148134